MFYHLIGITCNNIDQTFYPIDFGVILHLDF